MRTRSLWRKATDGVTRKSGSGRSTLAGTSSGGRAWPKTASGCYGPPEYALIFRSTITAVDAAVCFKSGLPASYAVAYRGWRINTRIRFFEAGVPIGYAVFGQQLTISDVLTLTEAGCPAQYAAHVIRFQGDGARILELWHAGVPLEYIEAILDEDGANG